MQPFESLQSRYVVLANDNIDTDQIIPARFLTSTRRSGFGPYLFYDWRFDADGRPRPGCPLNGPDAAGAQILVAGANFGCGSSREHAPWALLEFGFRAVLSTSIADIFRGNAYKVGLLAVTVPADVHAALVAGGGGPISIDLRRQEVSVEGASVRFDIDPFARHCLMHGQDHLDYLLSAGDTIARFERQRSRATDPAAGQLP